MNIANGLSKRVITKLSERNFRVTAARRTIIETLAKQVRPISIQQLVELVAADEASVYRTVSLLVAENLAEEVPVRGGRSQYALTHHHHHHVVCRSCQKVAHVDCTEIPRTPIIKDFSTIDEHEVTYYGLCKTCAIR